MSQTIKQARSFGLLKLPSRQKCWTLGTLWVFFLSIMLTGCSEAVQSAVPGATPPNATAIAQAGKPAIRLDPSTGYAGTFVNVHGTGWRPSTMVTIKLADAQGRTPVLAASTTD